MTDITVEVDGLPVDVDAAEWATDPEDVTERVRALRAELRLPPLADQDRDPDYRALYGEDG